MPEAVAEQLGIPFRVVNLMTEYREKVVKYLLEGYQAGITPNPDVMCNREMKFGVLWDWAQRARLRRHRDGALCAENDH
jgi:tRNA-specific 2-thiouridylase